MIHIWLLAYMNTLPDNYENCYTGWKSQVDSKYDSQFALRAIPDYEPLTFSFDFYEQMQFIVREDKKWGRVPYKGSIFLHWPWVLVGILQCNAWIYLPIFKIKYSWVFKAGQTRNTGIYIQLWENVLISDVNIVIIAAPVSTLEISSCLKMTSKRSMVSYWDEFQRYLAVCA